MISDHHPNRSRGKRLLLVLLLLGPILWGAAALWIDGPASRAQSGALAILFAGGALAALALARPVWRGAVAVAVAFGLVLSWWLGIEPRNDRPWQPDVAELSTSEINGDQLTIHNVRNFDYRSETDYQPRWETRTYDLTKIQGLDLFLSYWGPRVIAHTIVSWQFDGAPPLAISIETRKERGEEYSAITGFFRQFELYYVVADERDVIRIRTDFRNEDTHLYRISTPPERARSLLLSYLATVNRLAQEPAWYNAFSYSCTTSITRHILELGLAVPWSWKIFLNGYLDELLYEGGFINTSLPFENLRARSAISPAARTIENIADFSTAIRVGLPERPPPLAL